MKEIIIDEGVLQPGEPFTVESGERFVLYCCDCGLAHEVEASLDWNYDIELRFYRRDDLKKGGTQ